MKALLCLLLTPLACFGQYMPMADPAWFGTVATPAAVASETFSPTNIAGYPAYVHYEVEGNYSTADGRACLTNLSANAGLNLTNLATGTGAQPTLVASDLNGYSSLWCDGVDDYLQNIVYSTEQQVEMFAVVYQTNTTASNRSLITSTNGTYSQQLWGRNSSRAYMNAGSEVNPIGTIDLKTNAWTVLNVVINGASSTVYTNGVQGVVVNPGANVGRGLRLASLNLITFWSGRVAAITIWKTNLADIGTAGSFCTGARSNMFFYTTNRYALTVP